MSEIVPKVVHEPSAQDTVKSGFGRDRDVSYFVDSEVGLTMQGTTVEEIHNAHGQHYWKATAQIGTIFGSEVEGELTGFGRTKEAALAALAKERRDLNDSLWA